jgi:hypothetical protein
MMLTLVITKESNIKMQNAWKQSFVKRLHDALYLRIESPKQKLIFAKSSL